MKLRAVTKKFSQRQLQSDDDVMSVSSENIVTFPVFGWFGAIHKTDSGPMVYNFKVSLIILQASLILKVSLRSFSKPVVESIEEH